jgi:hypothetical protein
MRTPRAAKLCDAGVPVQLVDHAGRIHIHWI